MKLKTLLEHHMIEEWKDYYIDYNRLIVYINSHIPKKHDGQQPKESVEDDEERKIRYYCDWCVNKFEQCPQLLHKKDPEIEKLYTEENPDDIFDINNLRHHTFHKAVRLHHPHIVDNHNASQNHDNQLVSNIIPDDERISIVVSSIFQQNQQINYATQSMIREWIDQIKRECNKVSTFYMLIEEQVTTEFKLLSKKLQALHQNLQNPQSENQTPKQSRDYKDINNRNFAFYSQDSLAIPLSPDSRNRNESALRIPTSFQDFENDEKRKNTDNTFPEQPLTQQPVFLHSLKLSKKDNIHVVELKLCSFTLYQRVVALLNFASLNRVGFQKMCALFDKKMHVNTKELIMTDTVNIHPFSKPDELHNLVRELIELHSNVFENGDYNKGKIKLLESLSWNDWNENANFLMGLKMGFIVGLLLIVLYALNKKNTASPPNVIFIYRSVGAFIVWCWLWSFDCYIWSKYRINYVYIFEFDPATRLTWQQQFNDAANLSLVYLINAIIYIAFIGDLGSYSVIFPCMLYLLMICRLFFPLFSYWSSRRYLLNCLFHIITSPFGQVRFRDFFIADIITSMSKVLADFYFATCVLLNGKISAKGENYFCYNTKTIFTPIVLCLPYWFRLLQCFHLYFVSGQRKPHLPNALKYALILSVTMLSSLHAAWSQRSLSHWDFGRYFWICFTTISTLYAYFWDIHIDCNLFTTSGDRGGHKLFGRRLEYPVYWYFLIIIIDLILRFSWSFTLTATKLNPFFNNKMNTEWYTAVIEILELIRRSLWCLFRVENAHVTKKDEFSDYDYIPLLYEHLHQNEKITQKRPKFAMVEISLFIAVVITATIIIWVASV